ncbi:DUF167 domain-containing protein [Candidatus Kaiserbacteria bacterium]|nr:DUF167 domain-containing protein [Candidatus Kaiserbacteria bacterium]
MFVRVHVTPGARKERFLKVSNTEYHVAVREPAERNLANMRVRILLAEIFSVSVSNVRLLTGHRSSSKMFSIDISV